MTFNNIFDSSLVDYSKDFKKSDETYTKRIKFNLKYILTKISYEMAPYKNLNDGIGGWWFGDSSKAQTYRAYKLLKDFLFTTYINKDIYENLPINEIDLARAIGNKISYEEDWDWNMDGGQKETLTEIAADCIEHIKLEYPTFCIGILE